MKIRMVTTVSCIGFAACAFAEWQDPILQQNLQQAQMRAACILQEQQRAMSVIDNVNYGQPLLPAAQCGQMQVDQTIQQMRLANQFIDDPTEQSLRNAQFLANMAAIGKGNAKMQGWQNGLNERRKALDEFRRKTGRDFDRTDRPVNSGRLQDEWDRCNRTLDRFADEE